MANQIKPIATVFMLTLDDRQRNLLISDLNQIIDKAEQGLLLIRKAINSDPNVNFRNFLNSRYPKGKHALIPNFIWWTDEIIKDGWSSILPKELEPSSKTIDEISRIYGDFLPYASTTRGQFGLSRLNKAGQRLASPTWQLGRLLEDNGTINKDRQIIVVDDKDLLTENFKEVFYTNYNNPPIDFNVDQFSLKAVGNYVWQNLYGSKSKDLSKDISKYIDSIVFLKNLNTKATEPYASYYNFRKLIYSTPIGKLALLQAMRDKLSGYTVGSTIIDIPPLKADEESINAALLEDLFNSRILKSNIKFNIDEAIDAKYGRNYSSDRKDRLKTGFFRLFLNGSGGLTLPDNKKYAESIWEKIKLSGLLDLALGTGAISEFAQRRFSVGPDGLSNPELGSASNSLDPTRDTIWLTDLSNAITNLSRDPLILNIVQQYFPNLATLFFTAAAVAGDYSGGSEEDPVNSPEAMADTLLRAFGVDPETGKAVFKPAWEMINTAQRIKAALDEFPFRENIPPQTPDIFHFRLGAANFYVPPVAINVNSQFKTGSLTGGAIRQKSSPKFNAGYKETTINIKLFFPNYEEIWGIDIDVIKNMNIQLDKDFEIDFKASGNEEQIDKFLSSLRGMVAAFKYAPILPVKSHYLNTVHGITGVALSAMSISTIPNYPFALVVDLELLNFNHKPFLPMIKDFNQAVHWGKFRHYMGKAAGSMHSYINESFFLGNKTEEKTPNSGSLNENSDFDKDVDPENNYAPALQDGQAEPILEVDLMQDPFKQDIYNTNIIKEWRNGNNISIFIPAQTQTKLFTPDISSFRSDEEKLLEDTGQSVWESMLRSIGIDINQSKSYGLSLSSVIQTATEGSVSPSARRLVLESFDLILAGMNSDTLTESVYDSYAVAFVLENKSKLNQQEIDYIKTSPRIEPEQRFTTRAQKYFNNRQALEREIDGQIANWSLEEIRILFKTASKSTEGTLQSIATQVAQEKADSTNKEIAQFQDQAIEDVKRAFNVLFYNRFFNSGPIQKLIEAKRAREGSFQFNEWEVPMLRVDLDPKAVIVNGVSVTLSNNLAKMQLQMQEEPTYQHIGGKDTYVNISMTIFGEKELIKIRKVFEHINGLARLEHSTGVIGFMGIRNIVAGLAGVKYVMPLNYEVNTIPNFPHVYDVKMSFVDFDIFQQQREKLSSKQQQEMIEVFKTKKNPFLRIKQLWGSFNAYPDFPLSIKNSDNEVVGQLDPDYYFRAFEMFDSDVINNVTTQQDKINNTFIKPKEYKEATASAKQAKDNTIISTIKGFVQNDDVNSLREYFNKEQIPLNEAGGYVQAAVNQFFKGKKNNLLSDFINEYPNSDENIARFTSQSGVGSSSVSLNTGVGDLKFSDNSAAAEIQKVLQGTSMSVSEDGYISIDPDELTMHHSINIIPAAENVNDDKLPAILFHANGYHLGYVSKSSNKFYFTIDGVELVKADPSSSNNTELHYKPIEIPFTDTDDPTRAYNKTPDGAAHNPALGAGGANLAQTMSGYSSNDRDLPESMSSNVSSVSKHWERMLVDTQYRDVSGRMLRAFPTYMLWLIDEGGYFAGVKMFDNFYGLQSIIDFSIVQSEDILGDTLIFRVSNLYSKLSRPESSRIFGDDEEFNDQVLTQSDGLESVLDTVINRSRNLQSGMQNDYIVDINSIRLKPGVRVHLRAGYGSNPNGLQTLFNGIITQVENGEIVTITAQSDAIELSPMVNTTNKKGDSGKIDGGINTGLWLSEPRDLMVKLLSMSSSKTREALAHATRGFIFSENKFGIRHFGSMLYQPLTPEEEAKNNAVVNQVKDALDSLGDASGNVWGLGSVMGILSSGENENAPLLGFGPEVRLPGIALMQTLWANMSSQRDFELFKRNIYPGNGTGIAQFLGGDLGDGWSSIASITPEDKPNERLNYIGRVADMSWNNLTAQYDLKGNPDPKSVVDAQGQANQIRNRDGSAGAAKVLLGGGLAVAGVAAATLGAPLIGAAVVGAGLLGVLSGRGGTSLFNTMGITSGLDDDIPGLDEVSFRAQTYMRSVWDLFQVCARLLPNYIVAIRPFEDRSTVFYGKPHWLYTSGVVPLTAGYAIEDENAPKPIESDSVLAKTLKELNKISSPLADSSAFGASSKSLLSIDSEINQQLNAGDNNIFIPANTLNGKIIEFGIEDTTQFRDDKGIVKAKLPSGSGVLTVGYHLPVIPAGSTQTEAELKDQTKHSQISQLPLRYRFPFFTDRKDSVSLEDYAYYALSDRLGKWNGAQADYMKLTLDDWSYDDYKAKKKSTSWVALLKAELNLVSGVSTVDYGVKENANGEPVPIYLNKDSIPNYSNLDSTLNTSDLYIYSEKSSGSTIIRMPYPDEKISQSSKLSDFSKEYEILSNFQKANPDKNAASMKEWGAPTNEKDEQFYIAMKFPYKPGESKSSDFELDKDSVMELYQLMGISPDEAVGSVKDYKDRKVLVYSPTTGRAVVCRPAYYLWGEDTVGQLALRENYLSGLTLQNKRDVTEVYGNVEKITEDGGRGNSLAIEQKAYLTALVSPDAAYYLGVMSLTEVEKDWWSDKNHSKNDEGWGGTNGENGAESAITKLATAGIAPYPVPRWCYYAFVPDSIPVGVVPDIVLPAQEFITPDSDYISSDIRSHRIIGFGKFTGKAKAIKKATYNPQLGTNKEDGYYNLDYDKDLVQLQDALSANAYNSIGGNVLPSAAGQSNDGYFDLVKSGNYEKLSADVLKDILEEEMRPTSGTGNRTRFAAVYNESDETSRSARSFYDQDYDFNKEVLAGNGRTLQQASQIWDQFRVGYHTYTSVKEAFQRAYGLDPDSEEDIGEYLGFTSFANAEPSAASVRLLNEAITPKQYQEALKNLKTNVKKVDVFKKFGSTEGTAKDEFDLVFGDYSLTKRQDYSDFMGPLSSEIDPEKQKNYYEAIEFSRKNFIDSTNEDDDGLIDYFNNLIIERISSIISLITEGLLASGIEESQITSYIKSIKSPKQLFLFVVGSFRNTMWTDPYSRAWLVLKPNRKLSGEDNWDFNPVLKVFQAYIDPNNTFAKDKNKFKKLLAQNRGEGTSSSSIVGRALENTDNFIDRNIGPLISGLGDALSGLVNVFRLSMKQLGYGLSNIGKMSQQANVMNKVLNDSIYYSLGRPGSLLRAVDNPFTREYGEPVVEIREPFQRIHYISSFSHIISNQIQENIAGVATSITAVSDGKYPVTVALDKSTPAERQVEKTVETGIFFDNATGSGLFGALHPVMHPFEMIRGISKFAQGTPDELLARRVGLAHLKESLKDIYGGEIIVIGNGDIRPHDLVYIADVYERIYGMFEVEQVVHHFTSELGFITSITPNALVTVNDPTRWFMSSWVGTWMHMQALRNDTRLYMNSLGSGVSASGQISVDGLADSLQTQMVGGMQYTHGSSALTRDIMAHFTSSGVEDINDQVKNLVSQNSAISGGPISATGVGAVFAAATGLGATAGVFASMAIPGAGLLVKGAGGLIGAGAGGKLAWKGWSWVRDNVLDQHGCYIQYLNRNGQAMDAGLNQSGQGMVVGRYHTKKLLPGILGASTAVRTREGYSYIRTNDLLKSLGWKEKDITDLVRYVSFENALVNAQVLKYSGIGPEKAGLNRFFKVICKVVNIVDGDTVDVVDVFDTRNLTDQEKRFRIRLDGIDTPELNIIKTDIDNSGVTADIVGISIEDNIAKFYTATESTFQADDVVVIRNTFGLNTTAKIEQVKTETIENVINYWFTIKTVFPNKVFEQISGKATVYSRSSGALVNPKSPGGKATLFTQNAIKDKLIVLRVSPNEERISASFVPDNFEAGDTAYNKPEYYKKDIFGSRTLGIVFYKAPQEIIEKIIIEATSIFESKINLSNIKLSESLANTFYIESFKTRYETISKTVPDSTMIDYASQSGASRIKEASSEKKLAFNIYISLRILQYIYDKVSEWPNTEWDEYYEDGTPVSLNWELVTNNLANVYTKGLLVEQPSVITASESLALPSRIER
jgi:hypothetical protein